MKKEHFTSWESATESLAEALISAIEGIKKYNYQMIILYLPNKDHENPIKQPNPLLNNPFNWRCTSQFHRNEDEIKDALKRAINDTERDLLQNWTPIFGNPDAIEVYEKTGKITPELLKGIGRSSQVRTKHLVDYLREKGENERADIFENGYFNSGIWQPKKGIDYWADKDCMSYGVYYNSNNENLPIDQLHSILNNSIIELIKTTHP